MWHLVLTNWQPWLALAGFMAFWVWESAAPHRPRKRRGRHAVRNLSVAGLNAVVLTLVFAGLTVAVAETAAERGFGLLPVLGLAGAAQAVAAFLLLDVWTYAWHRLNHRVPFLWRFHRMHHSDPEMDVSTATRFHTGEIVLSSILRLPLIALLGLPLPVLVAYDIILLASTQFHHANLAVPSRVDKGIRWAMVSPEMHKIHHSRRREETDSNYSSVFSFWDRLAGSYRERATWNDLRLGLEGFDGEDRQSVRGLLATPVFPTGAQ